MNDKEKIALLMATIQDLRKAFYVAGKRSALQAAMERSKEAMNQVVSREARG